VIVLLATYSAVIIGFVGVMFWYTLKQKSKLLVQWLPSTLPMFELLVQIEENLRWPNGNALLSEEVFIIREKWTFFAAQRRERLFGRGAAYDARASAMRVALSSAEKLEGLADLIRAKLSKEAEAVGAGAAASDVTPKEQHRDGSLRVETRNPIERAAAEARGEGTWL